MTTRIYVLVLVAAAALLAFVRVSGRMATATDSVAPAAADGAFRDGYFQAQLDIRQNRHPHISSGRWSTAKDRVSFVAGYEQAYGQYIRVASERSARDSAQLAGYADGIADGTQDRRSAQPFQPARSSKVREAGVTYGAASEAYRDGYTSGYQQGYRSQPGEMIGQTFN